MFLLIHLHHSCSRDNEISTCCQDPPHFLQRPDFLFCWPTVLSPPTMFSLLFPLPLFISRLRASSVDSVLLRALSGLTLSSYIINNVNSWGGGLSFRCFWKGGRRIKLTSKQVTIRVGSTRLLFLCVLCVYLQSPPHTETYSKYSRIAFLWLWL